MTDPVRHDTLQCLDCGHKQTVTSAASALHADGQWHFYFGSRYDHCDECDGPMKVIDVAHQEVLEKQRSKR